MKNTERYVPTPWKFEKISPQTQALLKINSIFGDPDEFELWDANEDLVGVIKNRKVGEKIVRAVNSYEANQKHIKHLEDANNRNLEDKKGLLEIVKELRDIIKNHGDLQLGPKGRHRTLEQRVLDIIAQAEGD